MANKFDIDSSADTHLLNETFHVFSKSPGSPTTTLGGARLKSGHTTTATDVWADEIPAFFNAATQAKFDLFQSKAVKDDLCLFDGKVYQHNGTAFASLGTVDEVLVDGKTFSKNNKAVVKYHKGRTAINLTADNNNGDGSNDYTAKIYNAATGSTTFVPQFISAMDKMVDGIPSLAYDAVVSDGTGVLAEGLTADNDYICNSYAGVIQFNKTRSQGTVTVSAWEYIGEKLTSSLTELAKKVDSVTATAGEGVQAVTDAAATAGLSVSTKTITVEGETDPVEVKALDIDVANVDAQGAVTSGDEDKLVTATSAQYIAEKAASDKITAAIADDGAITDAISDAINDATLADGQKIATTTDTSKLVTVEDVTTYVSENAKVTLTADTADGKTGITIDNNGQAATSFTIGIDQTVIATKDSVDDLSDLVDGVSQTVADIQTSLSSGSVATAIQAAQDAADTAQETADEAKDTAETAVQSVIVNGAEAKSGTTVNITTIVGVDDTAANGIKVTKTSDNKVKVDVTPAIYTPATETVAGSWSSESDVVKASDVKAAITDAVNAITIPDVTTSAGAQTVGVTASGHVVSVTTADYTKASETGEIGTWTPTSKGYLVTGATVADAIGDVNAKVDALHQTPQFSVVVVAGVAEGTDWETAVDGGVKENVIYLVQDTDAADGSYIEYIAYKSGESIVTEQIGSTKIDLSGYAKTADLNVAETTANGLTYSQTDGVVSASVAQASTSQVGTVQLTDTYTSTEDDKAATGKSIAAAIATLDTAAPVGEGAVKVSQTNGIVSSVTVDTEALVDNNVIKESTTSDTALITAKDALAAIKLAKPSDYVKSVTVDSTTTSGETALTINDGRTTVYPNDLWGTTVSMVGNTITVQGGPIDGTLWGPKNGYNTGGETNVDGAYYPQGSKSITKVENNVVYNGATKVANIKTNELVNGYGMFNNTSLESFSSDLSSLVCSNQMFRYSTLASFSSDLSSLVNGNSMFSETPLESFSGDLSSLVNGNGMFYNTYLTSFSSDLSSLVNGSLMFNGSSLASFNGDLSSLVNGDCMFQNTSLTSFSSDLSSLVNGTSMFYNTPLTSFSSDLSSLVNGTSMFSYTSLESFSGDLSSLVYGPHMFSYTSLESFSGDLSSLVSGPYMFSDTSLDVESVELICDVLPNYNTENGGKKLQTAVWNASEGKYIYSDWSNSFSGFYYYPIIKINYNSNLISQGNVDNINRSFSTDFINNSNIKSIRISWKDISVLSEADRTTITKLFTDTATEKGWTFITNTELGGTVSPNAVMAADGTIQYYILAKKDEATEDNATHIDASGKLWKFDTAEAIIGPNIKYWSMFATVEDALTEWELTPWTKPTE